MNPPSKAPVHLPGLNGLRAIAALSVVFAHTINPIAGKNCLPWRFELPMAQFSVTLFFVISGFLITYLLLLEKDKSEINIRNFYIRRILRIWPIYYLFITVCLVVEVLFHPFSALISPTLWWYIFFTANVPFVVAVGIPILVHYWSIGVEEQFYLFWPWIVKASKHRLLFSALLILVTLFLSKSIIWWTLGKENIVYRFLGVTQFHSMMIGAIGAIAFKSKAVLPLKFILNLPVQAVAWLAFILLGVGALRLPAPVAHETVAGISLIIILGQVTDGKKLISLETRAFDFLGKISYGIYVIHPLVVFTLSWMFCRIYLPDMLNYLLLCLSALALTVLLAWLSYNFYEKRFLLLKGRFSTILSAGSKF